MTNNPKPELNPNKIGVFVRCVTCGLMKKPVGRSGPLTAHYCDDDCAGYRDKPFTWQSLARRDRSRVRVSGW